MRDMTCPKCGEMVAGEDLGDHPQFLTYYCDCGHTWSVGPSGKLEVRQGKIQFPDKETQLEYERWERMEPDDNDEVDI